MQNDNLVYAGKTPPVNDLIAEYKSCSPTAPSSIHRLSASDDIRLCRWPNQHADGKKHSTSSEAAFPFEGASDTRLPIADGIINELVDTSVDAFWRAWMANHNGETEESQYALKLADHFINRQFTSEIAREVELSEQFRQAYGWVVLNPTWIREVALKRERVTLAELMGAVGQSPEGESDSPLAKLPEMILDEQFDDLTVPMLKELYGVYASDQVVDGDDFQLPELSDSALKKFVRELRESGEAEIAVPYVCKNHPEITALRPWDDVFLSGDCTDIQKSRAVFRRVWMTEQDLKARAKLEGWNAAWVTEAIKHKGTSSFNTQNGATPPTDISHAMLGGQEDEGYYLTTGDSDLIEVLYATHRMLDKDDIPGIYLTILHAAVGQGTGGAGKASWAFHELMDYTGADMPYVTGQDRKSVV